MKAFVLILALFLSGCIETIKDKGYILEDGEKCRKFRVVDKFDGSKRCWLECYYDRENGEKKIEMYDFDCPKRNRKKRRS